MYEAFQRSFAKDSTEITSGFGHSGFGAELDIFFDRFGGASFGDGLYRVICPQDHAIWQKRIFQAFPEYERRTSCFAYDWLGRAFALDSPRATGKPNVLMFEPGTGEVLEIDSCLIGFHDQELIEHHDAALASSFYAEWRDAGGSVPKHSQCVGYKKPLFLNGSDEIENLVLSDLDVYWALMGQLIAKVRTLPFGTPVQITIDDKC